MKTGKLKRATVIVGVTLAAIGSTPFAHAEAAPGAAKASVMANCPGDGHLSTNYTCTSLSSGELYRRRYTLLQVEGQQTFRAPLVDCS
ncbi:hypothetical protein [Streptomyces lydicus]|uniref:hypothetical protein n=1 Tax=Streptomyces lydicus TaxID=47763 RepID=UPI00378EDF1E